jgi:hypothetical protein
VPEKELAVTPGERVAARDGDGWLRSLVLSPEGPRTGTVMFPDMASWLDSLLTFDLDPDLRSRVQTVRETATAVAR